MISGDEERCVLKPFRDKGKGWIIAEQPKRDAVGVFALQPAIGDRGTDVDRVGDLIA
jgi:hypothetical protein